MSIGKTSSGGRTSVWGPQAPFLKELWGGASQLAGGQMRSGIMPYAQNLVHSLMQQNNPQLSQQIQGLGADIGQFYNQQIMPGIANDAGAYGQFGGARQGIAQGLASQDALRQFSQGATNLRSQSYENQGVRANQLYNLGMAPWQAAWSPLINFANIVGNPAMTGGGGGGGFNIGLT